MSEEKEKQNSVGNNVEEGEQILEEYLKPRRYQSKFWLKIFLIVVFLLLAYIYKTGVLDKTIKPKELKESIEIFDVKSMWVQNEKIDTPDFKGIVMVPQISFRVRNVGKVTLHYVFFLGVFRLVDSPKAIGEGFAMAIKTPLKPGMESEPIVLRSKFGYEATSKEAFNKYSKDWQNATVQVLARSGAAGLTPLKSFNVSRRIEGLDVEIKLNIIPFITETEKKKVN